MAALAIQAAGGQFVVIWIVRLVTCRTPASIGAID
jgi:hypothetical protein